MNNPFKLLTAFEKRLWAVSVIVVSISYAVSYALSDANILSYISSLIGVSALIFIARGFIFGQILTIIFSILYAIVSYKYHYYGEMITYMGMTAPIAALSIITWIKHKYKDTNEVEVSHLTPLKILKLIILTILVTHLFYYVLKQLNTANLIISTISVATSFSASYLQMIRSPYYAIMYSLNDIVLIILWIIASISSISYIPMIFCFAMFLINDVYGFICWKRMQKRQAS